ncbi:MAG: hypothetical protein QOH61_2854 [Chloroflexota bacterium]|nr:hypothetical protein [Chloroflexota bacterium]
MTRASRLSAPILLLAGAIAIVLPMAAGRSDLLSALLSPPLAARVLLGLAAAIVGVVLVLRSAERVGSNRDARSLVRAVRLVFLAVGAFAAAAGWLLGSPVPIVAALVIAGVNLLETSFVLMVMAVQRDE